MCVVWRQVIKFGVLFRDSGSRSSPSYGASKVQNLLFFRLFWHEYLDFGEASRFVVGYYRGLCTGSMGMKIEVIRLLVRELWFFVCFLYLDNYVVTCFLILSFRLITMKLEILVFKSTTIQKDSMAEVRTIIISLVIY